VNQTERELFGRVYRCLNRLSGLGPSNPADIKAVVQAHQKTRQAISPLMYAVSNIGFGDYEDAVEDLVRAEELLGIEEAAKPEAERPSPESPSPPGPVTP
jgi:hypothetical protein